MFKFVRNIAIIAVALTATGAFLFGSNFTSIVGTGIRNFQENARDALPLEFELERAENELEQADGDIKNQRDRVADLMIACEDLGEELTQHKSQLSGDKRTFANLDRAYEATGFGARPVSYGGAMVTPANLEEQRDRVAYRISELVRTIELKDKLLETRQKALKQAEAHMQALITKRHRVTLAIAASKSDLEAVQLLRETTGVDFEASHLAAAEGIIGEVKGKLRRERLSLEIEAGASLPAIDSNIPNEDLLSEVREIVRANDSAL